MHANSISTINIMFNSIFNIFFNKQVTAVQSNCIIFFPECFEIAILSNVMLTMHISIKITIELESELEILVHHFLFVRLACRHFWYMRAPPRWRNKWTKMCNWNESQLFVKHAHLFTCLFLQENINF